MTSEVGEQGQPQPVAARRAASVGRLQHDADVEGDRRRGGRYETEQHHLGEGLGGHSIRAYPHHIPDEAYPFHEVDQPRGRIELETSEAVPRRGRERVVVVVPRLAERKRREPGQVPRLVPGLERLAAEEVTERVDAEGDVVEEEDPRS